MNKTIRISTCLLLLLSLFVGCGKQSQPPQTVVATINGEAITDREIDYFIKRNRTQIINRYAEQYGLTDFSDFWDKPFDGVTPRQALEQKALEDACDAKIRLLLMRDKGVYDDISFAGLENRAKAYNAEHENQKNTVGIRTIDLTTFYTYYLSTGEMTLKTLLGEAELKPASSEIEAYMSSHDGITEQGAISYIVDERYETYIADLLTNATIVQEGLQ